MSGTNAEDDFPVQTKEYTQLTLQYHQYFTDYIELNHYYDLFIICAEHGHVMFTVTHEDDFGSNLSVGKYKDTHLAKLWKTVVEEKRTVISDYQAYEPSNGEQTIFIGTPIYIDEKLVSVLVLQFSSQKINEVVLETHKIHESAESYIIGKSSDEKYRLKNDRVVKAGKIGDEKSDEVIVKCFEENKDGKSKKIGSTGDKEYV